MAHSDDDGALIGIAVLDADAYHFQINYHPHVEAGHRLVGMVGFFVKEEYRAKGIAQNLAKHLEQEFMRGYRDRRTPVVVCTGLACSVASRVFSKIAVYPA